jgi:hypothetical protein
MSKVKKELSMEDKHFAAATITSLLGIMKVKFTDAQIKKLLSKKNIEETLKLINELNEDK